MVPQAILEKLEPMGSGGAVSQSSLLFLLNHLIVGSKGCL